MGAGTSKEGLGSKRPNTEKRYAPTSLSDDDDEDSDDGSSCRQRCDQNIRWIRIWM